MPNPAEPPINMPNSIFRTMKSSSQEEYHPVANNSRKWFSWFFNRNKEITSNGRGNDARIVIRWRSSS